MQIRKLLEQLLENYSECEWLEFKKENSKPESIGEDVSALSNSAVLSDRHSGYIIWGVDDNTRSVVGTSFSPSTNKIGNEPIESWIIQRLNPRINIRFHEVEFDNARCVMLEIGSAQEYPVKFGQTAYIRVGSSTRKLVEYPGKEKDLWFKLSKRCFEHEPAMIDLWEQDVFDLLDTKTYCTLIGFPQASNKEAVTRLLADQLITLSDSGSYSITNLGAILFARYIEKFEFLKRKTVRVIKYEGEDRTKAEREVRGRLGYAAGIERMEEYITKSVPSKEEFKGVIRHNVPIYPRIAIREILVNALIHQDFQVIGTGPSVEIFSDRVEITNPGVPLIDVDRFIDHQPQCRNDKLADLMRKLGLSEERGSGIDRVIESVEALQLPAPEFSVPGTFTKITLFSPRTFLEMSKDDRVRACFQHACLMRVKNQQMTNASLRERFGLDDSYAAHMTKVLNDTKEVGLIKEADPHDQSKKFRRYVPHWAY